MKEKVSGFEWTIYLFVLISILALAAAITF